MQSYRWPHGLTTPLLNVRTRRFRKKPKGLTGEDIENVLQRLIQADQEALEVEFSVQEDLSVGQGEDDILDLVANIEENLMDDQEENIPTDDQSEIVSNLDDQEMIKNLELLGEQDQNEIMRTDLMDEIENQFDYVPENAFVFDTDELPEGDNLPLGNESQLDLLESEFQLESNAEIQNEIVQLQSRINEKEQQLQIAPPNPLIRQRLSAAIRQLEEELEHKKSLLRL